MLDGFEDEPVTVNGDMFEVSLTCIFNLIIQLYVIIGNIYMFVSVVWFKSEHHEINKETFPFCLYWNYFISCRDLQFT